LFVAVVILGNLYEDAIAALKEMTKEVDVKIYNQIGFNAEKHRR